MDVDEAQVEVEVTPAPDEQTHVALVAQFNPFPFTHDARNAIFVRRSLMSNELIFDLLLEQASIASPQFLFPPDSPETLLHLIDAIAKCPWDSLKKSCLHFYLLSHVSPDVAAKHATVCALPPQFVHLASACFLLDSGSQDDLARAVALLSDARIVQDLSSKILHTLSLAPHSVSSRLVRTYVRTAQPVLESYEDLAIYLRALMECSLADAWTFQRTFSETTPTRNQLIRTILDGCLIPPKPSVLPHLLSLPLTSFEFSLLQSYALSPPEELTPAAHSILQDLITVRLLHSGKYSDAIRLSRAFDTLNAKSRTGNTAALHKASEERQQMMRDVLAVVPEVQRRQLELEFNDEQVDGEAAALGASWATVGSDISMSWENLAASGSKAKEMARSGRLEGSPAPKLPGRSVPFGLFTSPAGSAPKRKKEANVYTNIFGTPTTNKSTPPVLPTIPTPGLAASMAAGMPPILSGFRPPQRFGFGATPTRQSQAAQNGVSPASMPLSGAGLKARNAFYEPEAPRASTSLFGGQAQGQKGSPFPIPKTRRVDSERKVSGGERPVPQPVVAAETLEDDRDQAPAEDIVMVDSDDPDSFVVRGGRRTSFRPPPQHDANANAEASTAGTSSVNGAHAPGTTLFGRHGDSVRSTGDTRRKSSPKARVLPGGFTSFELTGGASDAPRSAAPPVTHEQPRREPPSRSSRTRSSRSKEPEPQPKPRRLKIPGALFEDEEAEAEAGEEQDSVPSLPSAPVKAGRWTRASRASSATESDDDAPKASLRRSTRLSSTGPSPDPSPQKPDKKTTSKRATRPAGPDGAGRPTRKRKNVDD